MRIVLVGTGIEEVPPTGYGAVERVLYEYGQALERQGHSVRVVNEVRRHRSTDEYRFARRLRELLGDEPYDILHASTPVVANRLHRLGRPYVYTSHSRHWFWRPRLSHRWGFWLEKRAVRRAAAAIALTDPVLRAYRELARPPPSLPVRTIPFGVSREGLAPAWERRTGRRVLGVGVVAPLKRWELAARALRGTGASLRVAGPVGDPAYAARVRAAGDAVELLGEVPVERLRELYAESDLLVHPSSVEVLPRAVLEAMAAGLPVVGAAPVAPVVRNGETGLVADATRSEPELVKFLADSTATLLGDPALRRRYGEAARATVSREYDWDRIVVAHVELYDTVRAARVS